MFDSDNFDYFDNIVNRINNAIIADSDAPEI